MRAQRKEHEALISWLKFFDLEYIDASLADRLSALDINYQTQKEEAIELAVLPEYLALNSVSKQSMLLALERALAASDRDLRPLFDRVGMPFPTAVQSERAFLQSIQKLVHDR